MPDEQQVCTLLDPMVAPAVKQEAAIQQLGALRRAQEYGIYVDNMKHQHSYNNLPS